MKRKRECGLDDIQDGINARRWDSRKRKINATLKKKIKCLEPAAAK